MLKIASLTEYYLLVRLTKFKGDSMIGLMPNERLFLPMVACCKELINSLQRLDQHVDQQHVDRSINLSKFVKRQILGSFIGYYTY
jgi:hypothetical protein